MAKTAKINFQYYSGPELEQDEALAADGATWVAGKLGYFDANGLAAVLATDGVNVDFMFEEAQATATSTSTVKILKIPGASTKFQAFVASDAADAAAAITDKGDDYGIEVSSNGTDSIDTVNVNETTAVAFHVDNLIWEKEPMENAAADSPGQVIGHFIQSVLDAGA